MAVPARISIVTLGVADLGRSTAFYRTLGWELAPASTGQISFFRTAGGVLALYPFELLAADARMPPQRREGFGGLTIAINVERPDQVQPALDAAQAAGGKILKPATKAGWGGVSGYFADLDGYPWEVAWAPNSSFSPEGALKVR